MINGARCPACGGVLVPAPGRWTVLSCFACGGVWADLEATERVATALDQELIEIARSTAKSCGGTTDVAPNEDRACPICTKPLEAIRHARVALEVCREHGTWFDRDELGRMSRNSDYDRKLREPPPEYPPMRPPAGSSAHIVADILGDDEETRD